MSPTRQLRRPSLLPTALAALVLSWAIPPAAEGQLPLRSTKTQQPKVQQQVDVERANRRLLSPLGSAANVRRGWYRQNLSQPVVQGPVQGPVHGGFGGFVVPYAVYVNPAPSEPRVVDETPPASYQPP
ncbi:MAG: hypothetical protein AAFX50_21475, partial [Acidobacteriota bacterium]